MVSIATNRPEYGNDIAEEIRLFLGFSDVVVQERPDETAELCLVDNLEHHGEQMEVRASLRGLSYQDAFSIADCTPLERKKQEKRHVKLAAYHLLRRAYPSVNPPWGSLTGIRPTKLMRELSEQGGMEQAKAQFLNLFCVSQEKAELAESIVRIQTPIIASARARDVDVYIGIPYCRTRCLYCSFGSVVPKRAEELERYLAALYRDVELGAALLRDGGYRVRATYVGGGTPTILSATQLDNLLSHAEKCYGSLGSERTVEAGRPDTIDADKLRVLKSHTVDRISINPQTMRDETLVRMGRSHSVRDVLDTFELARKMGFDWINMDLIAALPGETIADMEQSCRQIERLAPENLTVHALAIKRSSRLKTVLDSYPLADPETAEAMIRLGADTAKRLGMSPYYMYRQKYMSGNLENVGYAKVDRICIYNIDMMEESVSILSNGAGSMTKRVFGGENRIERVPSPKDVPTYCEKLPELDREKRALFLD